MSRGNKDSRVVKETMGKGRSRSDDMRFKVLENSKESKRTRSKSHA
jgi:hypothetical protein